MKHTEWIVGKHYVITNRVYSRIYKKFSNGLIFEILQKTKNSDKPIDGSKTIISDMSYNELIGLDFEEFNLICVNGKPTKNTMSDELNKFETNLINMSDYFQGKKDSLNEMSNSTSVKMNGYNTVIAVIHEIIKDYKLFCESMLKTYD